jgi:disulfide bond formation protein DsbB
MAPQESAHVGLQLADGRRAANFTTRPAPAEDTGPPGLVLSTRGMGGGLRHREWSYWVWPLPPAGQVTFVCEWATADIPEAHASLDAQSILDAAGQSVQLWPEAHR